VVALKSRHKVSYKNMAKFLRSCGIKIRKESFYRQLGYDKIFFDKIDSHEKAYWLGFLGADGNLFKHMLSIRCIDRGHLDKFKKALKGGQKISKRLRGRLGPIYGYSIRDSLLAKQVRKLGIFPRKSLTYRFPTTEQVPSEFINSYLLGYFDGDGCIYRGYNKNRRVRWCFSMIVSPPFAKKCLKALCDGCGLNPTKIKNIPPMKSISFGSTNGFNLKKIYNFLYRNISQDIPLQRKRKLFIRLLKECPSVHKTGRWKSMETGLEKSNS